MPPGVVTCDGNGGVDVVENWPPPPPPATGGPWAPVWRNDLNPPGWDYQNMGGNADLPAAPPAAGKMRVQYSGYASQALGWPLPNPKRKRP